MQHKICKEAKTIWHPIAHCYNNIVTQMWPAAWPTKHFGTLLKFHFIAPLY